MLSSLICAAGTSSSTGSCHFFSAPPCSNALAAYSTTRCVCRAGHRPAPLGRRRAVTRSAHWQTARHHASPGGTAANHADQPATYTSMQSDPLAFWDSHPGLLLEVQTAGTQAAQPANGGSLLEDDALSFTDAELRLLSNAALDRAEMHSILAQQRDNWNKLFQRMLTSATMTACVLSGLSSQAQSLGLPALLLNAGSAAMMAIINQFQPSQLAKEQRTASRLFRKLASDIDYSLHVAPHLRKHPPLFLRDCRRRLQALGKAFPMPLTPGGLDKFPAKVVPPALIQPLPAHDQPASTAAEDHNTAAISLNSSTKTIRNRHSDNINGWDEDLSRDLQQVATLLTRSDIPKYTGWAQNLVTANKCLAVLAPLFAASAAVLNAVQLAINTPAVLIPSMHLGMWAAVCSVLAAFASSFSNDMQLGMVFELYRNSAGYYMDVKTSIEETLCIPAEHRENGALFRQRVAYQLGRLPAADNSSPDNYTWTPLVPPDAEEAGTLF